jgi:hypothetical protein
VWLATIAEKAMEGVKVQNRVWTFFTDLAAAGGRCGASEWDKFDFGKQQQMVRAVTDLEAAKLVVRETDPENASRSIASVTPVGWLVYFNENDYKMPAA